MVSGHSLRGIWQTGGLVGKDANVVIALYANVNGRNAQLSQARAEYKREQAACFAILREWVRQHIREVPHMYVFTNSMTEIEGRGYLWEIPYVKWGNENDPFYLLLQRTLKDIAEAFNCEEHSNHSSPYALEYAYVIGNGMEYNTIRMGAYAYAVGVKVETEVAADFLLEEDLSWVTDQT
jgi:hypothetical protein